MDTRAPQEGEATDKMQSRRRAGQGAVSSVLVQELRGRCERPFKMESALRAAPLIRMKNAGVLSSKADIALVCLDLTPVRNKPPSPGGPTTLPLPSSQVRV